MNKLVLAAAISAFSIAIPALAMAAPAPVPCEKSLSDTKGAIAGAKLAAADKTKVDDLVAKGLERCKADDDAGADDYFAQAMKLMGK
ncbi:MAG: hypothetical protein JWN11_722 [Hyphomicrobiales bacterium]|nr:hypothetical protein [Hyphomicrobiales bacterium]